MDAYHDFGNDLLIGPGGDLATVEGTDETRQRVLRRVFTPVQAYLGDLLYGAGIPQRVGAVLTDDQYGAIQSGILAACALEDAIAKTPAPVVVLSVVDNGLAGNVTYFDAATKTPQVIYFPAGT